MTLTAWSCERIRPDPRALKVLVERHWERGAWRRAWLDHPDADYARRAGYLYDDLPLGHDDAVERARSAAAALEPEEVGRAFLASLGTRRLELRSALGSYALASLLPTHPFIGRDGCLVCGAFEEHSVQALGVMNFERYRWGGTRHDDPAYMWFDLTLFRKTERPEPTERDAETFRALLAAVMRAPPGARPGDVARSLAGLLPSNTWERRILLEILSFAGVLEPRHRPVFSDGWVAFQDREQPPTPRNDWRYPFLWWRGGDGVNLDALRHYFPGHGLGIG